MNPDNYSLDDDAYWSASANKGFDFDEPGWLSQCEGARLSTKMRKNETWNQLDHLKSDGLNEVADNSIQNKDYRTSEVILSNSLSSTAVDNEIMRSSNLNSIFSSQSMKESRTIDLSPTKIVQHILLGHDFILERFKSKSQKRELLNAAVASHDGNAIIIAMLFLKDTLKKTIFYQEVMAAHEDALNVYLSYLKQNQEFEELEHILMLLSKDEDAAMFKYERAMDNQQSPEMRLKKIQNCFSTHFENSSINNFYVETVAEHLKVLKDQLTLQRYHHEHSTDEKLFASITGKQSLIDSSVIHTFMFCCLYYYGDKWPLNSNIFSFRSFYELSPKQCSWAAIRPLAVTKRWSNIDDFFSSEKWLGSRRMRSSVDFANVVRVLSKLNAPDQLLWRYVEFIKDEEKKLDVAKKVKCHKIIIELFSKQKDRCALLSYRKTLPSSSPAFAAVTAALENGSIKWKN